MPDHPPGRQAQWYADHDPCYRHGRSLPEHHGRDLTADEPEGLQQAAVPEPPPYAHYQQVSQREYPAQQRREGWPTPRSSPALWGWVGRGIACVLSDAPGQRRAPGRPRHGVRQYQLRDGPRPRGGASAARATAGTGPRVYPAAVRAAPAPSPPVPKSLRNYTSPTTRNLRCVQRRARRSRPPGSRPSAADSSSGPWAPRRRVPARRRG